MIPYKPGIVCLFKKQASIRFVVLVYSYDDNFKTLKEITRKKHQKNPKPVKNPQPPEKGGKERRGRHITVSAIQTLFSSMPARAYTGKQANTLSDTDAHHLGPQR